MIPCILWVGPNQKCFTLDVWTLPSFECFPRYLHRCELNLQGMLACIHNCLDHHKVWGSLRWQRKSRGSLIYDIIDDVVPHIFGSIPPMFRIKDLLGMRAWCSNGACMIGINGARQGDRFILSAPCTAIYSGQNAPSFSKSRTLHSAILWNCVCKKLEYWTQRKLILKLLLA